MSCYDTYIMGEILIDPPIPVADIPASNPFLYDETKDATDVCYHVEDIPAEDGASPATPHATAIVRTVPDSSFRGQPDELAQQVRECIAQFPDRRYTLDLLCEGENRDDTWRVYIGPDNEVRVEWAELVWPSAQPAPASTDNATTQ